MVGGISDSGGKSLSADTVSFDVVVEVGALNFHGLLTIHLILALVLVVVEIDTITFRSFSEFAWFWVPAVAEAKLLTTTSNVAVGMVMGTIPNTGFLSRIFEDVECAVEVLVSNLNIPDIYDFKTVGTVSFNSIIRV
jgi:hypothetical protein